MAEPARSPASSPGNNSNLHVRLHCAIDRMEKFVGEAGSIFTTTVIIPAPDTMSSPTRLQVKSTKQLGSPEEMIDIKCVVRSRYWKPKTGNVRYQAELWLVTE